MMHAYAETYLDDAMNNMGDMMDYVVHDLKMEADRFFGLFISSGLAEQFENGEAKYVSGMSGIELASEVLMRSGCEVDMPEPTQSTDKSEAYWCGYILAYYQWTTARPFREIMRFITFADVGRMYPTLHEAPEDKFVDTVNAIIRRSNPATKLQTLRKNIGISQSELARRSGVSLRSIQQYEQRKKDINKAQALSLIALSKTLGCKAEDLIEYDTENQCVL